MASLYNKNEQEKVLGQLDHIKTRLDTLAQIDRFPENKVLIDKVHEYYVESVKSRSHYTWELFEAEYRLYVDYLECVKGLSITPEVALKEIKLNSEQHVAIDDLANLMNAIYIVGCVIFAALCIATVCSVGLPLIAVDAMAGVIVTICCTVGALQAISQVTENDSFISTEHHKEALKNKNELLSFFKPVAQEKSSPVLPQGSTVKDEYHELKETNYEKLYGIYGTI